MSIARMRRLRLIGLKSEKNTILNELIKSGSFEVSPTSVEGAHPSERTHLDKVLGRQAKVSFAVGYLTSCINEYADLQVQNAAAVKKGKAAELPVRQLPKSVKGQTEIGYDDFYDVAAKEYELMTVCDEVEKCNFARLENKSLLLKTRNSLRAVLPYEAFPLPFSALGERQNVTVQLGYRAAPAAVDFGELPVFCENYPTTGGTLVGVVARLSDRDRVSSVLQAAGFSLCAMRDDITPAQAAESYRACERECLAKDAELLGKALDYAKYLTELKVLYDVLGQDIEKSTAELAFVTTAETFVAEGWIPSAQVDPVLEALHRKTTRIVTHLSDPQEDDIPPTLVQSKKAIRPYEDVTNMYSVPAYGEIDPNPFMAVFFFLFFGIMIGDAGYGLVLALGGLLVLRFVRLDRGVARMIALFAMGGISAIVWGVVFGGVFAIEGIPALWFNPIDEPLMMLGVSVVLGAVQLLTGYALKAAQSFRGGHPLDAILDSIFIFILFGGIACMALDMLLKPDAPLMSVGLGLMIAALAGILLTAGRHNKGILGKIMGGFSGLYGLVNLLSDVLSYARLFGLGLASGAIGMAFNTLGSMFFSIPVAGYVIGIVLLIPLHAFNLGIGVLGAYVHNARLQFLEFYGKFYCGDGRLFSPMGEKTKYVRIRPAKVGIADTVAEQDTVAA